MRPPRGGPDDLASRPATVETTLGQLVAAEPALERLMHSVRLPMKTAYDLAKLLNAVKREGKLYQAQRKTLIEELGEEIDATPQQREAGMPRRLLQVKPEHERQYGERMQELTDVATTITGAVPRSAFGEVELNPADLALCLPLITEG